MIANGGRRVGKTLCRPVAEWTKLLGQKNKDRWDLALAATARIHGFVLVTRNVHDFAGRQVRLLNPFMDPPVEIVG